MKEEHFSTLRTARFYRLGEIGYKTKELWFVFHGYGQLANEFLAIFSGHENERTAIVAPEGLSRFYKNGLLGSTGASWMTKEDRDSEIKDYLIYINSLYHHLTAGLNVAKMNINLLGFSQGAATVFRVFAHNKFKVAKLVMISAPPPKDIDYKKTRILSASTGIKILAGKEDALFRLEKTKESLIPFNESKVKYDFIIFDGGHKIDKELIRRYNLL